MHMTGNTILITGGSAGIGKALAIAFHERGNQVIITGRRRAALEAVVQDYPGMRWMELDMQDADAIRAFSDSLVTEHPELNVLINNAGIMISEDLLADPVDLTAAEDTVATNLLGPIRLTAALLPHLRRQTRATVMMVSSGLAFIPLTHTPTYCATKAAIHSYVQSLRHQLRGTAVEVLELAPPAVATDLMPGHRDSPHCMPLEDFIEESLARLEQATDEILVDRVKPLRNAESSGEYRKVFALLNGGR